jgi:hypothetical protein
MGFGVVAAALVVEITPALLEENLITVVAVVAVVPQAALRALEEWPLLGEMAELVELVLVLLQQAFNPVAVVVEAIRVHRVLVPLAVLSLPYLMAYKGASI